MLELEFHSLAKDTAEYKYKQFFCALIYLYFSEKNKNSFENSFM